MSETKTDLLEEPWIEKHRPRTLKDVVGNQDVLSRLRIIAEQGNLPNLILSGPPGCGKTTSMLCLAKEMLGAAFDKAVLELNASDSRGIDVVRSKIKMHAQKKVTLPPGRHKLIILDEADSMTKSAQQALRRTMELFSSTTRFALACNNSTKIIEPIQSRCAILRFSGLRDKEILERLLYVIKQEKIQTYDNGGLGALLFTSRGDMRYAINNLQATHLGQGAITASNVYNIVDTPHPQRIEKILVLACRGLLPKAIAEMQSLYSDGYSAIDLVSTCFRVTKTMALGDDLKLDALKQIIATHMVIADGVNSFLQLTGMLAKISMLRNTDEVSARYHLSLGAL